ncbi:MAG: molecular chaperone HtpG [Pumilibacteraceae bacterium]|nr:molecular chaperone HtpG [Pumilibacteraceae bacterium]
MKQFKTQSKRVLELMINSIYTNREIFLRELISNASDAIDKRHFKSLTDGGEQQSYSIRLIPDKQARTLTIEDDGIGMTAEELENNLGTIAESGTLAFKNAEKEKNELIGQFGVGFYAAFMVAKKVEVTSKAYGSDKAFMWTSEGVDGYEIVPAEKESVGTSVKLYLKDDDDDCRYGEYTEEYYLRMLVKKYSDYIRYPITMDVVRTKKEEGSDEEKTYTETVTLNGMTPLWKKQKSEIKKEDYDSFYAAKFHDYEPPVRVIHANIEGSVNYTALLFVPSHAGADYYTKDYKKGLQLYSNGVLITDCCEELVPDCYAFVKGVVDSSDLSLNISRETLQKDRQLKAIASGIEKKITAELTKMLESDRDNYEKMFSNFGLSLKFGAYNNFGFKKDQLKDLLLFYSEQKQKLITLKEYVADMKEGQDSIFYACGSDYNAIADMPQTEQVRAKGYDMLYFKDSVDEFVVKVLNEYEEKKFKNVQDGDLDLGSEEEKKQLEEKRAEYKDVAEFMKEKLEGKAEDVRFTDKPMKSAACLSADGEISLEMEKTFKSMKATSPVPVEAKKVLEISLLHPVAQKLKTLYDTDKDKLANYAKVLWGEALLLAGFDLDDTAEFTSLVSDLM